MHYVSTRSTAQLGSFCDILITGLAPDGGLSMPTAIPQIDQATLKIWRKLSYQDLAFEIMRQFISDIPSDTLSALITRSYTREKFHCDKITPLTPLEENSLYLLELSNGPSLAFKDIAMQFLGEVFEYVLGKQNSTINILGATSGDTGSAAEYAMLNKKNVTVFMLSPHGRMSAFQQAQMYSLDEPNIFNIAIKGVFDDCQDLVKQINMDAEFKEKYRIGAINSINWARVLAQCVYYFYAYFSLPMAHTTVDFCVPSGNFGNVFAGYLAKRMGLPIRRLIVATNENDVLYEFFTTGVYRVRSSKAILETSSPSMDIGKASNFERYIYLICGGDSQQVAQWWTILNQKGAIDFSATAYWRAIQDSGFVAGRSTHHNRIQTIRYVYQQYQRLIDPHTADGVYIARKLTDKQVPVICLETAQPAKFAATVQESLAIMPPRPLAFNDIESRPRHCHVMDKDSNALKTFITQHT